MQSQKNAILFTGAVASITLVLAAPASAQEIALEGISIFATASGDANAFEFPGQVSVIGRDQIEDFVATRPSDVFQGVPGVVFTGGTRRAGQVPSIRGFTDDATLVLFDDARQNFVSGHDGRLFLDPDILVAAEVVKGPTSSIYGSGALGGVFAFRTINAEDILEPGQLAAVRVKAGYESVDQEQTYSVTGVQMSESGAVDLVANLGYRTSGDVELGNNTTLTDGNDLASAFVKGSFKLSDGLTWRNSWIYFDRADQNANNPQLNAAPGDDNPLVDRTALSSTVQSKLEFNPSGNDLVDGNVVVYRAYNEVEEPEVGTGRALTREVETLGFKALNTSRLELASLGNVAWTYGTDIYQDDQTGGDSDSLGGARGGVPDAKSNFYGFFTEAEFEFGTPGQGLGQLEIIPGIRFDKFESESEIADSFDETAVSPKIAAAYRPVEWFSVFGNYGEAFRAPSYNEAYAAGEHFVIGANPSPFIPPNVNLTNEFIANPNLKPEESEGWELGATLSFKSVIASGDELKAKGSYYENDVTNLIDLEVTGPNGACFSPFPPAFCSFPGAGGTSQNVNVTNALIKGVEVEATYDSTYFYMKAAYSQIEGTDLDTGEFVGALFPDQLYLDAALKFPAYYTRLGVRALFADDFTNTNDERETGTTNVISKEELFRAGYTTVDVYAVWEPKAYGLGGLRVDLGIDNIGDEAYEVVRKDVFEEGRSFKAAVSYQAPICGTEFCSR
ncbi:MAG: TonB-dependent receptor [Pseudomonadota bacterium]